VARYPGVLTHRRQDPEAKLCGRLLHAVVVADDHVRLHEPLVELRWVAFR
jgi:hypothetical protein